MTTNKKNRVRIFVDDDQLGCLESFARKSGRTKSEIVRIVILESTKNLTDFSIVDGTDFSNLSVGARYHPIESTLLSSDNVCIIADAARDRYRTTSSFLYSIVAAATHGFDDYSVVNESYIIDGQQKEKGESNE